MALSKGGVPVPGTGKTPPADHPLLKELKAVLENDLIFNHLPLDRFLNALLSRNFTVGVIAREYDAFVQRAGGGNAYVAFVVFNHDGGASVYYWLAFGIPIQYD